MMILAAAVLSWLGLYIHNVADLPDQNVFSPESAYPAAVLVLLLVAWFTPARRPAAWLLLGWAWLNLIGGGILSVLPVSWWPFDPEQTLRHYAFHALYGVLQVPLIVAVTRQVRLPAKAIEVYDRELVAVGAGPSALPPHSAPAPRPDSLTPQALPARRRIRRRDLLPVLVWLMVAAAGGVCGAMVFDRVSSATDPAPASESQQVRRTLEVATGERDSVIAVVTGTPDGSVGALADDLRRVPGVHRVRTSAEGQLPAPAGGGVTIAAGLSAGLSDKQINTTVDAVRREFERFPPDRVLLGGYPVFDRELGRLAKADLARAEAVALPIVLILLGFAVRSRIGSALGLALVVTTVTGAMVVLLALSLVTEVSTFSINIVTMFGIGLAVDYGLLVFTRFRHERRRHTDIADAVTATMAGSGRTVALSGLTVAVALGGLLVFAEPVVRSMAYGGVGAVAMAVMSALTLMPALLRRFGHRIPIAPEVSPTGGFARLARAVQRRPLLIAAASLGLLALLALPLGSLTLQGVDVRSLPADATARTDAEQLEQRLPHLARAPITIVAGAAQTDPRVTAYLGEVRALDHVTAATVRPGVSGQLTVIDVAVDGPAGGRDAIDLVDTIRDHRPEFEVGVTGLTARFNDFIGGLTSRVPVAALLIGLTTFLVLLLATGGVLVSAKAVLMSLASLAASLGALVWTFQQGHLAGLLGFTPTGGLSLVIMVLAAVFAFGLSTDYEVFLLSSVVAARRDTADTDAAVAIGVQRTGRIITLAALLIVVVFAGFSTGGVLIVKQLGLGLAAAVLLDATIVRLALTPALMTLLGRRNWAGPGWARRASERFWKDSV